jgi:Papain family cysteine protease
VVEAILRRFKITKPLSAQQLIDCSKEFCWGCGGGWPDRALDYIKANGSATATAYKYTGVDGTCNYDPATMSFGKVVTESYHCQTDGKTTIN